MERFFATESLQDSVANAPVIPITEFYLSKLAAEPENAAAQHERDEYARNQERYVVISLWIDSRDSHRSIAARHYELPVVWKWLLLVEETQHFHVQRLSLTQRDVGEMKSSRVRLRVLLAI